MKEKLNLITLRYFDN